MWWIKPHQINPTLSYPSTLLADSHSPSVLFPTVEILRLWDVGSVRVSAVSPRALIHHCYCCLCSLTGCCAMFSSLECLLPFLMLACLHWWLSKEVSEPVRVLTWMDIEEPENDGAWEREACVGPHLLRLTSPRSEITWAFGSSEIMHGIED